MVGHFAICSSSVLHQQSKQQRSYPVNQPQQPNSLFEITSATGRLSTTLEKKSKAKLKPTGRFPGSPMSRISWQFPCPPPRQGLCFVKHHQPSIKVSSSLGGRWGGRLRVASAVGGPQTAPLCRWVWCFASLDDGSVASFLKHPRLMMITGKLDGWTMESTTILAMPSLLINQGLIYRWRLAIWWVGSVPTC